MPKWSGGGGGGGRRGSGGAAGGVAGAGAGEAGSCFLENQDMGVRKAVSAGKTKPSLRNRSCYTTPDIQQATIDRYASNIS